MCDTRKNMKGIQHIYPILGWRDSDVWGYIKDNNLPIAPAYTELGFTRLGCVGCPLISSTKRKIEEFEKCPRYLKSIKKHIGIGMSNNPQWKLTKITGGDPEKAIRWWLSGKTMASWEQLDKIPKLF